MSEQWKRTSPGFDTTREAYEHAGRCTCPSGDGSLRWPCPSHPADKGRVAPETAGVTDHKAEEGASEVPALDPQPWLFISDQVFGEIRSDHDKGYHGVSGTYWVFSPREGFEKERARYDAVDANEERR